MRPSRYNVTLPDEPNPGEMLIFNTLSGSLFALEPEYRHSLEALQNGAKLSSEDLERLHEMAVEGYVVEEGINEDEQVIHRLRKRTYLPGERFMAKVMTTMACNLNCQYCFESSMDRARSMDLPMAQAVVEKIKARVEQIGAREIVLDFYGGEPLLNQKVIEYISKELQPWCESTGREYGFTMTTNGTLLSPEVVKSLKPLGFKHARVSLDGVKEVQDSRRPFRKSSGSSFDTIIANLQEVVDLLPITVTTVYSEDDPAEFNEFVDELDRLGLLQKLALVEPGVETGYLDEKGKVCNPHLCEQNEQMAQRFVNLLGVLAVRGLKMNRDLLGSTNCALTVESGAWMFTPDGYIHRCPMLVDQPQYAIGQVGQDDYLPPYYEGLTKEVWLQCLEETDCAYLPLCGTGAGCRIAALGMHDDLWSIACSKGFYETFLPEAMRMELAAHQEED